MQITHISSPMFLKVEVHTINNGTLAILVSWTCRMALNNNKTMSEQWKQILLNLQTVTPFYSTSYQVLQTPQSSMSEYKCDCSFIHDIDVK